jgi:DMSO reductase family type II enzyme heme b subunit
MIRLDILVIEIAVGGAIALTAGCSEAPQVAPTNVVILQVTKLPSGSDDPAWTDAVQFDAKLIPQDLVEPRQLALSTEVVHVRAVTDGKEIAVRMQWDDATKDDLPGPAHFFDACAIQFPAEAQPTVPAPQMGEAGRPVLISYWNAAWQAMVDGRDDSLTAIYPNAAIDHHPFEAESLKKNPAEQQAMEARYAPARALGNLMSGPRSSSVEDLQAEGPSTLSPATDRVSRGNGERTPTGWSVVIVRPLPKGFDRQHGTQIAFAVWRGEAREVGARKMRTAWVPLAEETSL